jgi:hypothetical protein
MTKDYKSISDEELLNLKRRGGYAFRGARFRPHVPE